ncbi:MAG: metallophosphoesterase family protein [Bacillota bacterium]
MKILLVSDEENPLLWDYIRPENYSDIDLIISCGDLQAEYLSFLVTFIKAPLLYVHGNHDTGYIKAPPGGCESIDGRLVNIKGLRILGLGGSQKYNNAEFQYTEKQMAGRIKKLEPRLWINKGFDILVAHSAAHGLGDAPDLCHSGFKCFNRLIDKYTPRYFFHGHTHLNYGKTDRIIQYNNTSIVNAFQYYILEI